MTVKNRVRKTSVWAGCVGLAALACALTARGNEWIFVPNEAENTQGVISNDVWTLNAYVNGEGVLWVGTKEVTEYGNAFTGRGAGDLDLSGTVVSLGADGARTPWRIEEFSKAAFAATIGKPQVVTQFVFPTTMKSMGEWLFLGYNDAPGVLTNVVCVAPELKRLSGQAFQRNPGLATFTLVAPSLTELGFQALNCGNLSRVDCTAWELPRVTTLGSMAIAWTSGTGALKLPRARALYKWALLSMHQVREIELGTDYGLDDNVVLRLEDQALAECKNMGRLTFGPYASFNLSVTSEGADPRMDAFKSNTSLTNVVFTGRLLSNAAEALDAILIDRAVLTETAKERQIVISASANLGWRSRGRTPSGTCAPTA
ncbi:MAG: hypothetical protein ACI4RA_06430 [Kiritimatiellia bacterium]